MTHDQLVISNVSAELLRAMLMNPRVKPTDSGLATRAVEIAAEHHSALMTLFQKPGPVYLTPPARPDA